MPERQNLEEARKWLVAIDDVEQYKKIEGHIWSAERDSLRKEVARDPVKTVQSMVSGQSKYADYWIEEAMGTWITKDPAKAEDWYNKNWNSLPSTKAQYLAAAYANAALQQGDAATAQQWASHILDPKTKQRIQDGISKAGTNVGK